MDSTADEKSRTRSRAKRELPRWAQQRDASLSDLENRGTDPKTRLLASRLRTRAILDDLNSDLLEEAANEMERLANNAQHLLAWMRYTRRENIWLRHRIGLRYDRSKWQV